VEEKEKGVKGFLLLNIIYTFSRRCNEEEEEEKDKGTIRKRKRGARPRNFQAPRPFVDVLFMRRRRRW